jgi:hypothetical protein
MSEIPYFLSKSSIDNIVYGDLLDVDKRKVSCSDPIINYFFVTGLINKFFNMTPPPNSSKQTFNELMYLKELTNNVTQSEIDFATKAEVAEKTIYSDFCNNVLNLNCTPDTFKYIFDQSDPILMLLKQHFNRPRPNQLAPYFNIQIKFNVIVDAMHPAYPSGHALDAYLFALIFKKIKPEFSKEIENLSDKMADSRLIAGAHYLSDNLISKKLAEALIENNLIKVPPIS